MPRCCQWVLRRRILDESSGSYAKLADAFLEVFFRCKRSQSRRESIWAARPVICLLSIRSGGLWNAKVRTRSPVASISIASLPITNIVKFRRAHACCFLRDASECCEPGLSRAWVCLLVVEFAEAACVLAYLLDALAKALVRPRFCFLENLNQF